MTSVELSLSQYFWWMLISYMHPYISICLFPWWRLICYFSFLNMLCKHFVPLSCIYGRKYFVLNCSFAMLPCPCCFSLKNVYLVSLLFFNTLIIRMVPMLLWKTPGVGLALSSMDFRLIYVWLTWNDIYFLFGLLNCHRNWNMNFVIRPKYILVGQKQKTVGVVMANSGCRFSSIIEGLGSNKHREIRST